MSPCSQSSNPATPARRRGLAPRCLACLLGLCIFPMGPELRAQIETMKSSTVMIQCATAAVAVPERPGVLMYHIFTGSGFAVGDGRHVATNHHVVSEGDCSVVLEDGRKIRLSRTLSDNPTKDLAVVELSKDSGKRPVTFASASVPMKQGQDVIIVGYPAGTSDEESAVPQSEVRKGTIGGFTQYKGTDLYELSSVLNHGNSGGPVFNGCGEVVGIAVRKARATDTTPDLEAVSFAIQASELTAELDAAHLPYKTAWLPCLGDAGTRYSVYLALLLGVVAIFTSTRRGRQTLRTTIDTIRRYPRKPVPVLRAVSGHFAGMEIKLDGESVTIGRDPRLCQLVFPSDTKGISRTHCKIQFKVRSDGGGVWSLEDCGSSEGTFLGSGERLKPGQPRTLQAHDRFYLSDRVSEFEVKFKGN